MTNLSRSKKQNELLTPENSLILIPLIIGLISLSSLLLFVFRPLLNKLNIEESKIEVLEDKISYIPIYKNYIKKISKSTNKANKQQQRLIDLISDKNQLSAILTEINALIIKYDLEIKTIALQPIVKYTDNNTDGNNAIVDESIQDPFLIQSIEKHNFKLKIEGNYNSMINLLKDLESMQAISIIDGIEISSYQLKESQYDPNLIMSFNLITYANTNLNISKSNL